MKSLNILKWIGTIICVIGSFINTAGYNTGPLILLLGGMFWLYASFLMHDKHLFVTNLFMSVATVSGLLVKYYV